MDNKVYVSVVMPVLNGMPFFKAALDSVMNQSLHEIEIIVVDGKSNDGTREYVEKQMEADSRIRLITSEKRSMGAQYNTGIANATGRYLGFCESDDYLDPNMYEELYGVAVQNERAVAVKSDVLMTFGMGDETQTIYYPVLPADKFSNYNKDIDLLDVPNLVHTDPYMWNGIYLLDWLRKKNVKLNETPGAAFQDTGFANQVKLYADNMIYINEAFYHYRKDNDGSSTYKRGIGRFALWELRYGLAYIRSNQSVDIQRKELILSRLIILFVNAYAKDLFINKVNEYDEEILETSQELKQLTEKMSNAARSHLFGLDLLQPLLYNFDSFKTAAMDSWAGIAGVLHDFMTDIEHVKQVVVFGAAGNGQSIAGMIYKNGYRGKLVFCDNNKELQGNRILGTEVLSVENACAAFPQAIYVISNNYYYDAMTRQLREYKIQNDNIYKIPFLGIHGMLEVVDR